MKLNKKQTKELLSKGYTIVEVEYDIHGNIQKFLVGQEKDGSIFCCALAEHACIYVNNIELDLESKIDYDLGKIHGKKK